MQKHIYCSAGQVSFTFSFDNGKIIDYQDHYSSLGDVPFSVTMTLKPRQAALSFLTLRCIVAAFHPEVSFPRLVMFRSYDQTQDELQSLTHFQILDYNFFNNKDNFNKVTLKQLQNSSFSVYNREKNTALAEIFSIELKFTADCLTF